MKDESFGIEEDCLENGVSQSTVGQDESAVVFWWNRPSNLFTQHFHSKCK
ncbi:unnamed protein product [Protopolystoma xenopodis]|uniref:Uncharacterized protein n=1 Tax=Protopolystoma xenopodis TaxID=117903 RepID=A0A448XCX9_9PLAT|nr:unnamed protein product [Protopolystoma xenopodis]